MKSSSAPQTAAASSAEYARSEGAAWRSLVAAQALSANANAAPAARRTPPDQTRIPPLPLSRRTALFGAIAAPIFAAAQGSIAAPVADYAALVDPYTEETRIAAPRRALPYAAAYVHRGRRLVFVATQHDTAPEGPTFRAIARAFEIRPQTVIVEGIPTAWGFNPPRMLERLRDAQRLGALDSYLRGEPAYAMSLALTHDARFVGGEPSSHDVDLALYARGFAREDIAGVKMLQWLPQGRIAGEFDDPRDPRFVQFLDRTAARVAGDFQPQIPYTRELYEAWHARQFNTPVYRDAEYSARLDPSRPGRAAEIARAMGLERDRHVFSLIAEMLAPEDARTLVVFGGVHFMAMQRALAAAYGAPSFT